MRNIILFTALILFSTTNLFAQESKITQEYFVKPLLREIIADFPYVEPEINEELINKSLVSAIREIDQYFFFKKTGTKNKYNINFKEYTSVGSYSPRNYTGMFIRSSSVGEFGPGATDFKKFRGWSDEKSRLEEAGIKKKDEQEIVYNKLLEKRRELGILLAKYYHKYDYELKIYETLTLRCNEIRKQKKLILEKFSPYFNMIDNLLIYPKFSTKKNSAEENEILKKKLIEEGLVEIKEWEAKSSDGYTFIFPKISNKLSNRHQTLNGYSYFRLTNTREARWSFAEQRILSLWYGHLDNEFTLENFLKVCGSNVPSKEDFMKDEVAEDKLKGLIDEYIDVLNGRVGGNFQYDETLQKYPKSILYDNVVKNHYGIQDVNLAETRKKQSDLLEKEQIKKGGILRNKDYYKVTKRGESEYFDILSFGFNLSMTRKINYSNYFGSYEKKSNDTFKIVLFDDKTRTKLPELEVRVSSDGKKVYFGEDKIPYELDNSKESNCLKDKDGVWKSLDGKESFSTYYVPRWKSSITGGIETSGSLYKISSNKYAYVVYSTSWRGELVNNLVIITTADNCNTIYYGKEKKKMVFVK